MDNELNISKDTVIPNHIAIILDGNRRWARSKGLNPWDGHKAGYEAVKKLAHASRQFGVHTFTIWAFSTENWERPKGEIGELFRLLKIGLKEFEKECHEFEIKLVHLGRKDRFNKDLSNEISRVESMTKHYKKHILNLALDYGGRDEIVRATQKAIDSGIKSKDLDEKTFEKFLDTYSQPYPNPDLFIRTSGEQRTSGLLPWQMVYAEYYFNETHLPDFSPGKLKDAILDFSRRRRRFGGNDAMEHFVFDPKLVANLELKWWRLGKIPQGVTLLDYSIKHLKEQFGLSKDLAKKAAKYSYEAIVFQEKNKWDKAKISLKKFYKLIKGELKLAFEPEIVASLEVQLNKTKGESEELTKEHVAEVYRISLFQAAKAAHLRVLANVARNRGDWTKAEDYLEKYYLALKERVA